MFLRTLASHQFLVFGNHRRIIFCPTTTTDLRVYIIPFAALLSRKRTRHKFFSSLHLTFFLMGKGGRGYSSSDGIMCELAICVSLNTAVGCLYLWSESGCMLPCEWPPRCTGNLRGRSGRVPASCLGFMTPRAINRLSAFFLPVAVGDGPLMGPSAGDCPYYRWSSVRGYRHGCHRFAREDATEHPGSCDPGPCALIRHLLLYVCPGNVLFQAHQVVIPNSMSICE